MGCDTLHRAADDVDDAVSVSSNGSNGLRHKVLFFTFFTRSGFSILERIEWAATAASSSGVPFFVGFSILERIEWAAPPGWGTCPC